MAADKPFQLDPSKFKLGIWGVDGKIKDLIEKINTWDGLNHNGVPEIAEGFSFVTRFLPVIIAFFESIDFAEFKQWVLQQDLPFVKNKEKFIVAVNGLEQLSAEAAQSVQDTKTA